VSAAEDHRAIEAVLVRYARACDERRWDLLDDVFTDDVVWAMGADEVAGRSSRAASMRSNLDGCGPTQHLVGNFAIDVRGDEATCHSYVRAFHIGAGERSHLTWELFGNYHDRLRRLPAGWRIHHRSMEVRFELGSRTVLGPG